MSAIAFRSRVLWCRARVPVLAAAVGVACLLPIPPVSGDALATPSEDVTERRDAVMEAHLLVLAQAAGEKPEHEREERPTAPATEAKQPAAARPLSPEEIVAAIKLRAQHALAKRRARKWSLNNILTWTVGNESNPGLQQKHAEALYMEEYLSTTFGYKLTPQLTWQLGYSLDALNYNEYTDGSTLTNSLTTKLIYRFAKTFRAEAHYTFDDSDYPYDDGASTWDQKVHLRLRQGFWKSYYHYLGWTYLNKQYKTKLKRESTSARIPTKYRKDQRQTFIYEIGGTVADVNTLKLKQEFYFNDSNEGHQDFNDAADYKVKASGSHDWTDAFSSSAGFTYELKRYDERVNTAPRPVKQRDYTKTFELGATYKLSPNVDLAYTWKYKRNDSNELAQSYQNVTNSLALTASF